MFQSKRLGKNRVTGNGHEGMTAGPAGEHWTDIQV
jgi:hypothetical protein